MYTVCTTKLYSTPYQFYVGLASKIKISLRLLGANYCEVKMNTYPILFHPSPQKKIDSSHLLKQYYKLNTFSVNKFLDPD